MSGPDSLRRRFVTCFHSCAPALTLHATVLIVAAGLMQQGDRWGREDWDYFAHHYEAMRRTVLEYGEFPWWNPWSCGGLPLAANPQVGVVSLNFLLVLLLGTYPGLRWSAIVHLLLSAEGCRRLAADWVRDPIACALAGLVYAASGVVSLYLAVGHLGIELAAWVPWAIMFAWRLERDGRWGVALGAVLAVAAHSSFQYFLVYTFLVLPVLLCWRGWTCNKPGRRRLLLGSALAGSLFLALAGMRTALVTELVLDFPRGPISLIKQRVGPALGTIALAWPGQQADFIAPEWAGTESVGWHEYGCYVGFVPCLLFLGSLRGGWCWWHTLAFTCFWLAAGNTSWFHPSWLVAKVPVLSALRLATRWRLLGVLGVALGSASMLARFRGSVRCWVRIAALFLAAIASVDVAIQARAVYRDAFVVVPPSLERPVVDTGIVQLHGFPIVSGANSTMLSTLQAGYGVIYGYEPLVGVRGSPISGRVWLEHPDYKGEYWSSAGLVRQVRWSPNRIELEAPTAAVVFINQNPGAYWLVNGRRVFQQLRAVDRHEPFQVQADADGRVELRVWPRTWPWGLALTAVGFLGILGCALLSLAWRDSEANQERCIA